MDAPLFVAHVVLGTLFGVVILLPAYSVQAVVFFALTQRARVSAMETALLCGGLQALFVWCWDLAVGIQPNLGGRFSLVVPMVLAGTLCGLIAGWSAC